MVSSVKSISNHYETLKILPTANTEEIASAFATQLRLARLRPEITIARLSEVSVAYETLRDPIKRWAYDVSIGLKSEPKIAPPNPASVTGTRLADRLSRATSAPQAAEPPARAEEQRSHVPGESRVASFIAASLREPTMEEEEAARPSSRHPAAEGLTRGSPSEPFVAPTRADLVFEDDAFEGERRPRRWIYAGLGAGGALVVGAFGLVYAMPHAGIAGPSGATQGAQPAVTVPLPPAAGMADESADPVTPAPQEPDGKAIVAVPEKTPLEAAEASPAQQEPAAASGEAAGEPQATQGSTTEAVASLSEVEPAGDALAGSASPAVSGAKLPLPNATVARTIERIGFACGQVVSSDGVEGAGPGVYKVVCSSGDTYQARPVHGRYRFRRWGAH